MKLKARLVFAFMAFALSMLLPSAGRAEEYVNTSDKWQRVTLWETGFDNINHEDYVEEWTFNPEDSTEMMTFWYFEVYDEPTSVGRNIVYILAPGESFNYVSAEGGTEWMSDLDWTEYCDANVYRKHREWRYSSYLRERWIDSVQEFDEQPLG
jgi:hypothetical protein